MNDLSPKPPSERMLAFVWAAISTVLAGVVVWGAVQSEDPLSHYIHTDTMRHILAFGAIGTCAAFMPSARLRIIALAAVLAFALTVEIIQIPIPDRTASWSDLFNSAIGGFGGFGLGAAATALLDEMRGSLSPRVRGERQLSRAALPKP
jgi:VanZ family protein